jgi:hypothetical protein
MMLLMTPPHTDPAQADNVVTTAGSAKDPPTPDRLRGIALQTAAVARPNHPAALGI